MIPLWQLSSNKSIKHVVSKKLLSKAYSSALFSRLLLEVFRNTDWMDNVAIFWNIMPLDHAPNNSFIDRALTILSKKGCILRCFT